ncbi:uncharacterized protein V1510DRAFT_370882 [Dipodascopsis tothii]|uniref:uncharacterized protein n=1 Tax=Dipodascopsis tothii TaxID=44089 RepID=UPI0034CF1A8D
MGSNGAGGSVGAGAAGADSRSTSAGADGEAIGGSGDGAAGAGAAGGVKRKPTRQLELEQYVTRDALHAAAFKDHTDRHIAFLRQKRQEIEFYETLRPIRQTNAEVIYGEGYKGFGNGHTLGKSQLIMPRDRRRAGRRSRELRITREQMRRQSDMAEHLVPVRLDLDFDKGKIRDTFTWNLHDKLIPLDVFAEAWCEDYALPLHHAPHVAKTIAEQVSDYQPHHYDVAEARPLDPAAPYVAHKDDDLRVVIKLDITVGQHNLVDQFEWDLNAPDNSPEQFAERLCAELALPSEFVTAVAHSIREQAQHFTKSLLLVGHTFDGRMVEDEDIRKELCPSVTESFRPKHLLSDFTPALYELSDAELGRADKDNERENRWKRRQGRAIGRRGGIVLPDLKEPLRTFRTPIVSTMLPGAMDKVPEKPLVPLDEFGDMESTPTLHGTRRTRHNTGQRSPSPSRYHNHPRLMVRLRAPGLRRWMLQNSHKLAPMPRPPPTRRGVAPVTPVNTTTQTLINTDNLPPVPTWLENGLANLRGIYTSDEFHAVMRAMQTVDTRTGYVTTNPVARIRCSDCPGKLYTPGPGMSVENFEVHLRNKGHRERVDARLRAEDTHKR